MVRELAALLRQLGPAEIHPAIYLLQGQLGPPYEAAQFGVNEKLTTRALTSFFGRPLDQIEREYRKRGDHGTVAEALMRAGAGRRRRGPALTVQSVFDALADLAGTAGAGSVDSGVTPPYWVEPALVVEVFADEITRSPIHTAGQEESGSGFALRFPRM